MLTGLLFLQLVFTVPDSTGRTFTIDLDDMSVLQVLSETSQLVTSCPFGSPPLVVIAYSEDGDELERIAPMSEVVMLLQVDGGSIREIPAVAVPNGENVSIVAREDGALWRELERSKDVGIEIEHDGESYASSRFSVLGNFQGDSVAIQMMPCQ